MNKEKWIKKIIGGAVKGHGFRYVGCLKDEDTGTNNYRYRRKNDGINMQYIIIGIRFNETGLGFVCGRACETAYEAANETGLIESSFKMDQHGFIVCKDEEEFKLVLYYFREIILKKGFDILEEISRPTTEGRLMEVISFKLYREHKALNKEYRKRYGLENIKSTEELMKRISTIIVESGDKAFTEAQEILMGMAAVYGEELVKNAGEYGFGTVGLIPV